MAPVGVEVEVVGVRSGSESVERRGLGAEARWCQSPRFSASLIGLRVRVCGDAVGTVKVGSRAPADPSFIWRCARGGPLPRTAGAPNQGTSRIGPIRRSGPDPEIRCGRDHIPNILPLDLHILSLLRQSAHSQISA
jgi:hypothetical protein